MHKGVAYPGEHAAIIDQRAWDKAHAVMAAPATRPERYTILDELDLSRAAVEELVERALGVPAS